MNTTACGDWVLFKEEKCIKVFIEDDVQTYENAKRICVAREESESSLLMIQSEEEQQFIENLLFEDNEIVENVWLGIKRDSKTKQFHYESKHNQTVYGYENWGKIKNRTGYDCVEIVPDGDQRGKWMNTSCKKKNIVVCQKMQNWEFARMLDVMLDMKKEMEFMKSKIFNSLIPIGFVYVQLPNESEPKKMWENFQWKEVTSQYANAFFRAEGNRSESFGIIQSESSPRLTKVRTTNKSSRGENNSKISPNEWSTEVYTGILMIKFKIINRCTDEFDCLFPGSKLESYNYESSINHQQISFYVSGDEVRPLNMAVKIWKRIQ